MSFESETIKHALDELLNGKHFCICKLRDIGESIGVDPSNSQDYKYLNLLHCVNYSDMSDELRNSIPERVMRCLDPRSRINTGIMAKALLIEGNNHINIEDTNLHLIKHV